MMKFVPRTIAFVVVFFATGVSAFVVPNCSVKVARGTDAPITFRRVLAPLDGSAVSSDGGGSGGPAVLDKPETVKKSKEDEDIKEKEKQGSEGWEVRLFNDPMNKREFVARCLTEICGLSDGQSYQVMMQAHQFGIAVIGRYHFERAELYHNGLRDQGLFVDMQPVDDDQ
mmetsp:Transcript_17080/g.31900  ORF Transcript_17080/g.31900 Transcript_17080/m.31900 type:complete len:170 (-) Transcript_17080:239-748(-)|eukprot:CAMPEP_0197433468 /NCGR_PEP_ID=MMETSP1175-20131217/1359_1 /TAXON_ID=1003142 /ORGANISM="Triceratium dubium, Strain CCMP147" /LENGTH=169 /DNA_ID=CAMNT_0042961869 /DNA_START=111 /DNA_END=620 /DNA_ORIENTATION=-